MKKHGGMKHGIDVTLSAGEALPIVVIVVVADNDVCL